MLYTRPANRTRLSKGAKVALLTDYVAYYQELAKTEPSTLNLKVPRDAFEKRAHSFNRLVAFNFVVDLHHGFISGKFVRKTGVSLT